MNQIDWDKLNRELKRKNHMHDFWTKISTISFASAMVCFLVFALIKSVSIIALFGGIIFAVFGFAVLIGLAYYGSVKMEEMISDNQPKKRGR